MYLNYYNFILFIPMILISNLMIFISNSWYSMWMIMEINLISFIALLLFDKLMIAEYSMKYFLIQSYNSYLYLMASLFLSCSILSIKELSIFVMSFSMFSKLGIMPFHLWYLNMMKSINWMNLFFLSVFQKIIPLFILNYLLNFMSMKFLNLNLLILMISSFISSIMGLNQMMIKLIMGYSSIIQISWIIFLMYLNEIMGINYFIIYSFIMLNMFLMFNKFNFLNINQLNLLKLNNKNMYLCLMIMMMSLAGIPPLFGFIMKWISIQSLFLNMNFNILIFLIFNSLISMFFYLRLMYFSMVNFFLSLKFNYKFLNLYKNFNFKYIYLNWLLMMLILIYEII